MLHSLKHLQIVVLLVSASAPMWILGQEQSCFHEYAYRTQEQQTIQINSDYPVEELTDIELSYARPQLVNAFHQYCFDDQLHLTNTVTYDNAYDSDDWITPIAKTEVTETVVRLYDFEGNLIRETMREQDPDSIYTYELENLDSYGRYPTLVYPSPEAIEELRQSGLTVYEIGDERLYVLDGHVETIVDYREYTITKNKLVENIIQEQQVQYFIPTDENNSLLQKTVDYTYKVFPSGAVFRIENTKVFYDHQVNGEPLNYVENQDLRSVSQNEKEKGQKSFGSFSSMELFSNYKFEIAPSPAKDEVVITVPGLDQYDMAKLEILDVAGKLQYSAQVSTQIMHKVNLQDFVSGHYYVRLTMGDKVLSEPFIVIK